MMQIYPQIKLTKGINHFKSEIIHALNQLNQIDEADYYEYEESSSVDRIFIYTIGVLFSNDIDEKKGVDQYLTKVIGSNIN
jgi:hypothetical protein